MPKSLASLTDPKPEPVQVEEPQPKVNKTVELSVAEVKMKAIEVGLQSIVQSATVSIAGISNKHQYVRACVHQVFVLAEIVEQEYIKFHAKNVD